MRQHPKNLKGRGSTILLGLVLAVALVAAAARTADAQTRVKPINGTQGVESVVQGRGGEGGDASRQNSGFAHLDGPAQHSGNRGLRVAGQRILITNRTSVFPNLNGSSTGLREGQFSGRELTVFGEITAYGIEAVLVIVRPTGGEEIRYSSNDGGPDDNFVPSETDPRVGRARNNTEE